MKNIMKNIATPLVASAIIVAGLAGAAATDAIPNPLPNAVAGNVIKATDINDLATAVGILDERSALAVQYDANGDIDFNGVGLESTGNIVATVDSDENGNGAFFVRTGADTTNRFSVNEDGNLGLFNASSPTYPVRAALSDHYLKTGAGVGHQRPFLIENKATPANWDPTQTSSAITGLSVSTLSNGRLTATDTVTVQKAQTITHGNYSGLGEITASYGLQIIPYAKTGTVGDFYDIMLSDRQDGATLLPGARHFAIAQNEETAVSVFDGKVGFGISSSTADPLPLTQVDIFGTLRVADGGEICDSTIAGAIKFDTTTSKHQGCDGTAWNDLY